eukprot:TRINITY_DN90063_c0_g1_i1.p3 TRINITY_DN90063_c0_g1~~TRINITY_DN90063_c0_g1_i1.p3  ORF type:complete len:177 (+),score=11.68 TRINITY_DN90063_c0_g1_i1:225-755(+)
MPTTHSWPISKPTATVASRKPPTKCSWSTKPTIPTSIPVTWPGKVPPSVPVIASVHLPASASLLVETSATTSSQCRISIPATVTPVRLARCSALSDDSCVQNAVPPMGVTFIRDPVQKQLCYTNFVQLIKLIFDIWFFVSEAEDTFDGQAFACVDAGYSLSSAVRVPGIKVCHAVT